MTTEEGEGQNGAGLWDVEQVTGELRISRAHLFAMVKRAQFPKGLKLGRRRVWPVADVRAWLVEQAAETKQGGNSNDRTDI